MPLEMSSHVTVTCEGPHCSVVFKFVQEDPDTHPDAMWRFITLVRFDGTKYLFCSAACLLDFMRDYEPLKSPRERHEAGEAAHTRAVVDGAVAEFQGRIIKPQPGKIIDLARRAIRGEAS